MSDKRKASSYHSSPVVEGFNDVLDARARGAEVEGQK
jgi:hypothetical protein